MTPDDGLAQLITAAAIAGVSLWTVVYATGGQAGGVSAIAASPLFYLGLSAAFAASIWASHLTEISAAGGSPRSLAVILGAAVLFRFMAVPAAPALSDDIHRYLWDGHVQSHGVNPYRYAPADPALQPLATDYRPRINNPDLPTIYPPVSQAMFLIAALLPGGAAGWKILMVLFDMGTVLALAAILKHRGMDPSRVVIYAWSPLAVVEVGWSGHGDPVGVFCLALAALAIAKGRPALSVAACALSGGAKYAGWLALPSLAKRAGWRSAAAAPAALAVIYLPYASAGWGVFGSIADYAERWRFNDSIYAVLLGAVERTGLSAAVRGVLVTLGWLDPGARWDTSVTLHLIAALSLAKMIAAALLVFIAVRILKRGWDDPLREMFAITGTALVLSPTVHPWYLLWVAPFLAVVPRLSWTWLTFAAMIFSYPMMAARSDGADPLRWLAYVEYVPFFAILAVESARRRLWERA